MTPLSRRSLLRFLAAGVGFVLFGCRRSDPAGLVEPLRDLTQYPESLAAIGRAFLEQSPDETLETLTEWLAERLDWREGMAREELGRRLAERVRTDFRDSRTISVSYWLLSETEVRWAAVVALAPPAAS